MSSARLAPEKEGLSFIPEADEHGAPPAEQPAERRQRAQLVAEAAIALRVEDLCPARARYMCIWGAIYM